MPTKPLTNTSRVMPDKARVYDKSEPGRGYVVVIYGLYIGSIIALVTAPLGALVAHYRLGRGAAWLASGEEYEGAWLADQKHGKGTLRQPDGSTYNGEAATAGQEAAGKRGLSPLATAGDRKRATFLAHIAAHRLGRDV